MNEGKNVPMKITKISSNTQYFSGSMILLTYNKKLKKHFLQYFDSSCIFLSQIHTLKNK